MYLSIIIFADFCNVNSGCLQDNVSTVICIKGFIVSNTTTTESTNAQPFLPFACRIYKPGSKTLGIARLELNPLGPVHKMVSIVEFEVNDNITLSLIQVLVSAAKTSNGGVLFSLIIIDFSAVQPLLSVTITRYIPGLVTSGIGSVETKLFGPVVLYETIFKLTICNATAESIHESSFAFNAIFGFSIRCITVIVSIDIHPFKPTTRTV